MISNIVIEQGSSKDSEKIFNNMPIEDIIRSTRGKITSKSDLKYESKDVISNLIARNINNNELIGFCDAIDVTDYMYEERMNTKVDTIVCLSIFVLPKFRGKHIASMLLYKMEESLKNIFNNNVIEIRYTVREDNIPSINLALRSGYNIVEKWEDNFIDYYKIINTKRTKELLKSIYKKRG